MPNNNWCRNVQFQKTIIHTLPTEGFFCFAHPSPQEITLNLHTLLLKVWLARPSSPSEFLMTFHGVVWILSGTEQNMLPQCFNCITRGLYYITSYPVKSKCRSTQINPICLPNAVLLMQSKVTDYSNLIKLLSFIC